MKYADSSILVFCKAPITGEVKTRLIPTLGANKACTIYKMLLEEAINSASEAELAQVQLWCTPHVTHEYFTQFDGVNLYVQEGNDLGERMYKALSVTLKENQRAVLIGADCPTIDKTYLDRAIALLEDHDAVIGPAEDGGYGLIGLRESRTNYFDDIEWSTDQVCAETCRRFNVAGLNWALLPRIWDVDRPEDVDRYLLSKA